MPSHAFHRRLAVGFVLVLVCAALIAGASLLAVRSIRAHSEAVSRTYAHELIQAERLDAVIETKVAAAHALLMTGQDIYEQRVAASHTEAMKIIAELRKEIESREGQQALDAIERAENEHQADVEAVVAKRHAGAPLNRLIQDWQATAAARREELSGAVQTLRARKQALLEEAQQQQARSAGLVVKLVVIIAIAGLLLAGLLGLLLSRTLVRMFNAENQAREAAEQARHWFATTLGSIGDGVIATDTRGRVTFMNATAEQLTGWIAADGIGKMLDDVFPIRDESTDEPQDNPVARVLQTGLAARLVSHTVLVGRTGERRPVDDSAAPIRDMHGRITGVVLVFRDVTERQRAEATIRESREWLETTMRSLGDAVIATDMHGRITLMNPVAQQLTGWKEAEAMGAPLESVFCIVSEHTRQRLQNPVEKVLASGQVVGLANHTVLIAKDGKEWPLDDSGAPIRDGKGNLIGVVLVFREITERRRTEEVLQRLSAIVEGSHDAIIAKTLDGTITSWNAAAEALYGYKAEEVIGRSVTLLAPPDCVDEMPGILQRLARGERIEHFETVRRRKDGTQITVWLNVSPILDGAGRVVGASSIVHDITSRKQAEAVLRASEEQFRTLANAIPQLAWMANPDGWIFWYNRRWYEYTGTTPQQMEGWGWQSVHDPAVLPEVMRRWEATIASGSPFDMVFPLRGSDGVFRPFLTQVMPVKNEAGNVLRWFGTNTDLSGEREAAAAVERELQHRRLALEAAELGAWDYHFQTGEVFWDERCHKQFGFRPGEPVTDEVAIGRIHAEDRPEVRSALDRALAGVDGGAYHVEFRVIWPDHSVHWITSHGRVYFEGEGEQRRPQRFIGVNTDITTRKHAEEAMLRSEKLASVGRMAATIAHEINNPLEAVMNALYLAMSDPSTSQAAGAYLRTADEQLARVAQLTRQTLAFYRESRARTVVKLPDLIDDVLAFYQRKLDDKQIAVSKRYDLQNGAVPGTTGELRQVLSNLVANSLDALPARGKLHLRVKHCTRPDGESAVRLTVADTGAGIARENLARIFEPFFTTKQVVGTGLGLWITHEIVARHGGRVAVRSRLGKGTVFWIYLPGNDAGLAASASTA